MHKTYNDPEIGEITLRKNIRSRRITMRVRRDGSVLVTLPWFVTYGSALDFFKQGRDWVLKTRNKMRQNASSATPEEIARQTELAKSILPARLAELAAQYGFVYNQVRIKHNVSNWGSCSARHNINLNYRLVLLPDDLRDYVLLHELCHLKHMNHGPEFHALLEDVCPGHLAKQRALRAWKPF